MTLTCQRCLDGKHHRCRGCACTSCKAARPAPVKGLTRGAGTGRVRPPRKAPAPRKKAERDYAAEWQARKERTAPTVTHKPCAGTGWRPTSDGDVTRCFCVTSTMRRSRAA